MSECVLAVGEVFPLEKGKKKDSQEKVLGQTVGPGACFCLFGKRVDQLSVCELFTRSPLVSVLGWPGRAWNEHQAHSPSRPRPFQLAVLSGVLGLQAPQALDAWGYPGPAPLQVCWKLPQRLWEAGHCTLPGQLLACNHPSTSGPLPNHATQANHQTNPFVQPPQ